MSAEDARDRAQDAAATTMWACLQRDAAPCATEAGHFYPFELSEQQIATLIGAVAKIRAGDELSAWYQQAIVNTVTAAVTKMVDDFAFAEALKEDEDVDPPEEERDEALEWAGAA